MPALGRGDIAIELVLREPESIPLLRATAFLYDLNLLHDALVIGTDERFRAYRFDDAFWRRSGRPLRANEQMLLRSLDYGSPFKVDVGVQRAVASAGLIASLATSIAVVTKLPLEREKLRAEIELAQAQKIRTELENAKSLRDDFGVPIEEMLRQDRVEAYAAYRQTMERLAEQGFTADALRVHAFELDRR